MAETIIIIIVNFVTQTSLIMQKLFQTGEDSISVRQGLSEYTSSDHCREGSPRRACLFGIQSSMTADAVTMLWPPCQ